MADLRIRPARADDAAACADIYRPYVTDTAISFEFDPPDASEMALRIERFAALGWFIAEMNERVFGYAYACPHAERAAFAYSVDVAIYVDREMRQRGIGRALYGALLPALGQRFHCAVAGITLPNDASIAFHEAFGFRKAAHYREIGRKFDAWHDTGRWQLLFDL